MHGLHGVKKAFALLKGREGQRVTVEEIQIVTGWKRATVQTYIAKKWSDLLQRRGDAFVVQGFAGMSEETFLQRNSEGRPTLSPFAYDVGLSFAGEDREYVEEVATTLKAYGVDVFYDDFERAALWGKDLYEYLDNVYRAQCRFCVVFISEHYLKKPWPRHERRSAQARALADSSEYVLPARFDDTEVPGILTTTGFIDLRTESPADVAVLIAQKLGKFSEIEALVAELRAELEPDGYEITLDGESLIFVNESEDYYNDFNVRIFLEMERDGRLDWFLRSSIFVR
jgi:hypothetical protein